MDEAAFENERRIEARHDELMLAILVAGLRATEVTREDDWRQGEGVVDQARADLAEIRRQLNGEG